jgi:Glycosyl transferase family 2
MSRLDSLHTLSYSVVVELENANTIGCPDVGETLRVLAEQIAELSPAGPSTRPQVIFAHGGSESESDGVVESIRRGVPRLCEVARVCCVGVPEGRYYELKNAGIAQADGELIVLLDSDMVPEVGWLRTLLTPFERPEVLVTNGHTYLGHSGFMSRMLAIVWMFPLRDYDDRKANSRPLNANNCAFRAEWIRANPFPIDNGFKVGCTKLMKRAEQLGVKMIRVPAYAEHAPLQGWRFLFWRAMVTGRDADRKFTDIKSPSRPKRLLSAVKYWLRMESRVVRRVLGLHRHVAMPLWEIPAAIAVGCSFYSVVFLGQLARLSGLTSDRCEHVPAFAENH